MRLLLLVVPFALAISLLAACGGCGHGPHRHPTGQSWERPPEFEVECRCTDHGVECDDGATARRSAGGETT